MISDRIEAMLMEIERKTCDYKIEWRPIDEYMKYCNDNQYISEKIMMLEANEFIDFYKEKSFFVRKDGSYMFLIAYQETSAIDGTVSEQCEMYASFYPNSDPVVIPGYIDGGIKTIQKSVINYWDFINCNSVSEVHEVIGVLNRFAH